MFFLVAGRLRRGVVICISLPFYQLHQLWVLKHCLYCGCLCVHVCAIDLPFTKSFRCVFFSSWSTSTWGCNMHFTSLLSVTPAVGFKALLILWVCVCVGLCVFMCVQLISLLLRALGVFF